jgi:dephospho-CoA kinase
LHSKHSENASTLPGKGAQTSAIMTTTSKRPYIVGLTGGIGSGKSTVSKMFEDLGAQIIDADVISRELLQPGSPALGEVENYFGKQLFQSDGLDRAKLRKIIFTDPVAKAWLEQLLHPLIRAEILRRIQQSSKPWILLSAPLLLENKAYDFIDTVLVVDAPESLQIARTRARDQISEQQIANIMAAQMSREDRLMAADNIIDNDADLAHLQRQVANLFKQFEEKAREWHQTS